MTRLGVGVLGAGRFAEFVLAAAATLPELEIVAVADPDAERARVLADRYDARAVVDAAALLADEAVEAVLVAAPPSTHASAVRQALAADRHVFCEKPVALTEADAEAVRAAVAASDRTFVIDHVLRYNPVLAALRRLQAAGLVGPVRRFAFENDAADEDLPPAHWFWDEAVSGGVLLEHGVHFFDAAAMLIAAAPRRVQAMASARPDGRTDRVVCTVAHDGGALATHAHAFTHAHRAERQLMRLDLGLAEARVHGWIPLRADIDAWVDDHAAAGFDALPGRLRELLDVPGVRPSGSERITVDVRRHAGPAGSAAPHHVTACIELGGPDAKQRVYAESVRAALLDLALCARTGARPRADVASAHAAVLVAAAGTRALRDGRTHHLPEEPCIA